jgi:translation initiation factor IF-3
MFHGREISHKEIGETALKLFKNFLTDYIEESQPILNGKDLVVVLTKFK